MAVDPNNRMQQNVWIPDHIYSTFYYQNGCDHEKTRRAIREALKQGLITPSVSSHPVQTNQVSKPEKRRKPPKEWMV